MGAARTDACSVCAATLAARVETPCGHAFCRPCMVRVFAQQHGFGCCPTCQSFIRKASCLLGAKGADAPGSIAGSVFTQGALGFASYHFDEAGPYISFASPLCAEWALLDNGERLPDKKPFSDAECDEAGGCFRGSIDWTPSAWREDARWEYTMVFAPDRSTIMRGMVRAFSAAGECTRTDHFGAELQYINHKYAGEASARRQPEPRSQFSAGFGLSQLGQASTRSGLYPTTTAGLKYGQLCT